MIKCTKTINRDSNDRTVCIKHRIKPDQSFKFVNTKIDELKEGIPLPFFLYFKRKSSTYNEPKGNIRLFHR